MEILGRTRRIEPIAPQSARPQAEDEQLSAAPAKAVAYKCMRIENHIKSP